MTSPVDMQLFCETALNLEQLAESTFSGELDKFLESPELVDLCDESIAVTLNAVIGLRDSWGIE